MTHAPSARPKRAAMADDPAEHRWFADRCALHEGCGRRACRRAKSCRGPLGPSRYLPHLALPFCLGCALDELYEPVARWTALRDRVFAARDKLREAGLLPD